MMAAIVVPSARPSIASTRACFEFGRLSRGEPAAGFALLGIDLLRAQIKAELFAHHSREEASDRVPLPMGRAYDGGNRCSLRSAEHREHARLFRVRSAVARGAGFGLGLAQLMLRTSRLLGCNGVPPAGGDGLGCSGTDLVDGNRAKLVSVGAPTASSLTPIASRPCLVMRRISPPRMEERKLAFCRGFRGPPLPEPRARKPSGSPTEVLPGWGLLRTPGPFQRMGGPTAGPWPRALAGRSRPAAAGQSADRPGAFTGLGRHFGRDEQMFGAE
jgi:hypothetical protein